MAKWQDTYEELKKRKKAIDNTSSSSERQKVSNTYKNNTGYQNNLITTKNNIDKNNIAYVKNTNTKTTNTVAPTTSTKKDDEKKWYQKIINLDNVKNIPYTKPFDDGYDFGDVTKTILGTKTNINKAVGSTALDVGVGVLKGVSDIGTSVSKLISGGVAQVADWVGEDEYADKVRNRIAGKDEETNKNLENKTLSGLLNKANKKLDKNSVLGETADEITGGVGYYAGMLAAQSVGVPWQLTAGVTSAGNELGNAYANGAEDWEAWLSSGISAGVEIGSEYIFGGVKLPGTGKAIEPLLGKVTDKISKNGLKYLAQSGIQIGGEGLEEVISGLGSAIGQKLTYMDDKELKELYTSEDALKDFVIGAAVSGITMAGNPGTYQNIKDGRSLITGRTTEEATTIENLTKEAQANAEKQKGSALTIKEKNNIEKVISGETQNKINDLKEKLENTKDETRKAKIQEQITELQQQVDNVYSLINIENQNQENTENSTENTENTENLQNTVENNVINDTTNKTLNNIATQIQTLESQLDTSQNAVQQQEILNQINALEQKYNEILQQEQNTGLPVQDVQPKELQTNEDIGPIQEVTQKEISKPTTQEPKTNSSVEVESNTPKDVKSSSNIEVGKNNKNTVNKEVNNEVNQIEERKVINNEVTENLQEQSTKEPLEKEISEDAKDMAREIKRFMEQDEIDGQLIDELIENTKYYKENYIDEDNIEELGMTYDEADEHNRKLYDKIYDALINELEKDGISGRYDKGKDKYIYDRQELAKKGYNELLDYLDKKNVKYEVSRSTEAGYVPSIYIKNADGETIYRIANHDNGYVDDFDMVYNGAYNTLYNDKDYANWKENIIPKVEKETGLQIGQQTTTSGQQSGQEKQIQGLESYSRKEIKDITRDYIQEKLEENDLYDVEINDLEIIGSRNRGTAKENSDLDIVVEYTGDIREDDLFNILNEEPMYIDGVQVDINPINEYDSGTLKEFMERSNKYDKDVLSKLDEEAKRYDDLKETNKIEYFKKGNGDVRVTMYNSNNDVVNQIDLYSEGFAQKQLGNKLGEYVYNYATDSFKNISLGNNKINSETDYMMEHRPTESGVYASDISKTTNIEDYPNGEYMPSDVYEHPEWYFNMREDYSKESYNVLKKIKGNPEAEITIYRATTGNKINKGDWITLSKKYAEFHNNSQFDGKGNILELEVKAKDVQYAGDDINEFGYFPQESQIPTKEELANLEDIRLNKSGSEYASAFYDLEKKYGKENLYKGLNEYKSTGKAITNEQVVKQVSEQVEDAIAPIQETVKELKQTLEEVKKVTEEPKAITEADLEDFYRFIQETAPNEAPENIDREVEQSINTVQDNISMDEKSLKALSKNIKKELGLNKEQTNELNRVIQSAVKNNYSREELFNQINYKFGEQSFEIRLNDVEDVQRALRNKRLYVDEFIQSDIADYYYLKQKNFGKIRFSNKGLPVDVAYMELSSTYPNFFPQDIEVPSDQFLRIVEVANMDKTQVEKYNIPESEISELSDFIYESIQDYKYNEKLKAYNDYYKDIPLEEVAPPYDNDLEEMANEKEQDNTIAPIKQNVSEKPLKERYEAIEHYKADEKKYDDTPMTRIKPDKANFEKRVMESAKEIEKELGYSPKDPTKESSYDLTDTSENKRIADILTEEPTKAKKDQRLWATMKANLFDKGAVFEDLSIKTKNRELMGKWDYTLTSEARAQNVIGNGHKEYDASTKSMKQTSKSLNDIVAEVENTGLKKEFYDYMYHKHNVDRMNLESKAKEKIIDLTNMMETTLIEDEANAIEKQIDALKKTVNKPVFGDSVTSEVSQRVVEQYENENPVFMDYAQDVYDYVNADRQELVKEGVISQETADLWSEMYPHYVPIRRVDANGNAINVPLDTGRTGVNAPIKKATGGSSDILPLFDTMAMRTLQTYRAVAKNSFGVELKNTLGTTIENQQTNFDEVIDSVDNQESLLQENNGKPTFTVFENGEKITYSITQDMYDALKPLSESSILSKTFKPFNTASNFHRGLLTEYNPVFMITNGVKDIQDVLINSQHTAKTYSKLPEAYAQLVKKGYWYQEYVSNGGEQNSYFDSQENTFKTENKGIKKLLDIPPLSTISKMNNFIEMAPRLAEYIASREQGRSVEVSMLDAARVTTNFKAGGNVTKWANRNGATFLNASVQGAMQQVRNIREANMNGLRGWANLATKFAVAGLPALLLNGLMWDDDDDYEELSDYVKQNYYVVWKKDDGTFIRIPKGRTVAVIQEAVQQVENAKTGDDEVDLKSFLDLVLNNLAPNNPIDNNILSPITQVMSNKTWYGGDLVPTRLQNVPANEQYDESTDMFSRWLGDKLNISPMKINYVLNQYSGGVGDVVLPMITPKATNDVDSVGDYLLAPFKDKFTTNAIMNNKNPGDLFETSEKLTTNAKSSKATDDDVLKNKFINSIKTEMNELYKQKREIQNSSLSKGEKYEQVLEIQSQINELSKYGLNNYKDVKISGNYASVGNRQYKLNFDDEWEKINDKQIAKQEEVSNSLNISPSEYWSNKEEYDYAYENPGKYAIATAITDYDTYKTYSKDIYELKADKDEDGKSISGSRKEKVISYVNELDLSIPQKAMLIRQTYSSFDDYNDEIVNYVADLDIDYDTKKAILEALDMKVYDDGSVGW